METESLRKCLIFGFTLENLAGPCPAKGLCDTRLGHQVARKSQNILKSLGRRARPPKGGNKIYKSKIKLEKEIPYLSYSIIPKYL